MCKCTPEIRTPFCGKLGCEWPNAKPEGARDTLTADESPIEISGDEYATLIRESIDGKYVSALFGIGWVGLDVCPSNDWALKRIAEMRGIAT